MSNCKKFSVLSVDNIVPGRNGSGMINVGTHLAGTTRAANVTWGTHAATGTVSASEIVGGGLINTGATGVIALTMPTAAAVIAAFADAGIDIRVGMNFTVIVTAAAAFAITMTPSASITFDSAAATVAVASQKSALFTFRVASVTVGSEAIVIDSIVSA